MKSKLPIAFGLIVLSGPIAQAQSTLYWGGTNTSGPAALPTTSAGYAATWNTATTNWATSASGATYQAWAANSTAYFGYWTDNTKPVVTLANDISLGGLINNTTTTTSILEIGASAPRVITASPDSSNIFTVNTVRGAYDANPHLRLTTNVSLAGASGTTLRKTGAGNLEIQSVSNNFFGPVVVDMGGLLITTSGSMNGTTSFNLGATPFNPAVTSYGGNGTAGSTLTVSAKTYGSQNQLNDSANINLNYGIFSYNGFSNASNQASSESIGKITLGSFGQLNLSNALLGSTLPTLTVTDGTSGIDRGPGGLGTLIVGVNSTSQLPTTNLVVTNFGAGTKGSLLPWITTSRAEFMQVNSGTSVLERIASTDAPTNLSTWAASSNYRVGGNGGAFSPSSSIAADLSINSLGIYTSTAGSSGSPTVTIAATKTLTLASGGLAYQAGGNAFISGGSLTSGTNKLYISSGTSNGGTLTIASSITGTLDVVVSGVSTVNLAPTASNTYTGTTYVNGGALSATGTGSVVAIPGDLVIRSNGSASLSGASALAVNKSITIDNGGLLSLGNAATFSGVVTNNGGNISITNNQLQTFNNAGTGLAFNGGAITTPSSGSSTSALELLTNVSYDASSTTQATFNRMGGSTNFITLNTGNNTANAERTFNVANSTTLAVGVAEMVVDTVLANGGSGSTTGSLKKTGTGTLQLTEANTYTGGTFVAAGTLELGALTGAAQTGLTATASNATNAGGAILTFSQRGVTDSMIIGQAVSGTGIASGRTIAGILNDYQVVLNGTSGTSNTASTDVAVTGLTRTGSLAGGSVTVGGTGATGTPTLAGVGSIAGATTIAAAGTGVAGTHSVGSAGVNNGVGTQTFSSTLDYGTGSIFEWSLQAASATDPGVVSNAATGSYDQVVASGASGSVTGSDAIFKIVLGGNAFTDAFWDTNKSWSDIFSGTGAASNLASIFTTFGGANVNTDGTVTGHSGQFSFNGSSTLTWSAVPEPTSALAGLLCVAGLLRRRR